MWPAPYPSHPPRCAGCRAGPCTSVSAQVRPLQLAHEVGGEHAHALMEHHAHVLHRAARRRAVKLDVLEEAAGKGFRALHAGGTGGVGMEHGHSWEANGRPMERQVKRQVMRPGQTPNARVPTHTPHF
eukprot:65300-Chlamydomonas_euryale.AAC.1